MRRAVNRAEALRKLHAHKAYLAREFGVTNITLFGSVARDDATSTSDIDILVRFDGPATSRRYFGAQFYLEDLFGCSVDLVTDKALRPELRPYIEREAFHLRRPTRQAGVAVLPRRHDCLRGEGARLHGQPGSSRFRRQQPDLRCHSAQPGTDRRGRYPYSGGGTRRARGDPLADDHRHAQPAHPWLPRHR
ncbi:MAG: nucleotidyltransferase family protein [Nitrococcus mobilis]|nr:nucleotidyltransferase family protein [Nitrococcus mobilis]